MPTLFRFRNSLFVPPCADAWLMGRQTIPEDGPITLGTVVCAFAQYAIGKADVNKNQMLTPRASRSPASVRVLQF